MNQQERQNITRQNEAYVAQWFETSGFQSTRLDVDNGKSGKNADWRFSRDEITFLCEVKTIFSGGQGGLSIEQQKRKLLEQQRKLEAYRRAGMQVILPREAYFKLTPRPYPIHKEEESNNFLRELQDILESDNDIRDFPFDVVISIGGLYVPYGEGRQEFVNWIKSLVVWASKHHHPSGYPITGTFTFIFPPMQQNDKEIHVPAHVQVYGPKLEHQLQVGFIYGGASYNEERIFALFEDGISQLRASMKRDDNNRNIPVMAFWSRSDYLGFSSLLFHDEIGRQLGGEIPERYYLFDWAFSHYPDLAAILLFELKNISCKDFWDISISRNLVPQAFIIPTPNQSEYAQLLKEVFTQQAVFLEAVPSDPLDDSTE